MDERFAGAQCFVRKGMVHDPPLSSMHGLVNSVPCCHDMDIAWVCIIVLGLFDICLVVENGLEACGSVDQDTIGSDTKGWTYRRIC